jgi:hypothetical protein
MCCIGIARAARNTTSYKKSSLNTLSGLPRRLTDRHLPIRELVRIPFQRKSTMIIATTAKSVRNVKSARRIVTEEDGEDCEVVVVREGEEVEEEIIEGECDCDE